MNGVAEIDLLKAPCYCGLICACVCFQVQPVCPLYWLLCVVVTPQVLSTRQEIPCSFTFPQTAASVVEALMPPTPEVKHQKQINKPRTQGSISIVQHKDMVNRE